MAKLVFSMPSVFDSALASYVARKEPEEDRLKRKIAFLEDKLKRARTKHDEIAVKLRKVKEYAEVLKEDRETLFCGNFIFMGGIKRFRRLVLREECNTFPTWKWTPLPDKTLRVANVTSTSRFYSGSPHDPEAVQLILEYLERPTADFKLGRLALELASGLEPYLRGIGYPTADANLVTLALQGMEAEMKEKEAKKKEEQEKLITDLAIPISTIFRYLDPRFMTTSQEETNMIITRHWNGKSQKKMGNVKLLPQLLPADLRAEETREFLALMDTGGDKEEDAAPDLGPRIVEISDEEIVEAGEAAEPEKDASSGQISPEAPGAPTVNGIGEIDYPPESYGTGLISPVTNPEWEQESDLTDSRAPSPWQGIGSGEAERSLTISAWWMIRRLGRGVRRLDSEADSLASTSSFEGVTSCTSGSSSGADSIAPAGNGFCDLGQPSPSAGNGRRSSKRARDGDGQAGNSDEDGAPNGNRENNAAPEKTPPSLRFACPYQKFDPLGSPLCCMPSNSNRLRGGYDTFSQIKSHIFRNHDPFTRCPSCWKACRTVREAEGHKDAFKCIKRASPGKYWITQEQRRQVRGQQFRATSEENWYCLFSLLLPDANVDAYRAERRYFPCTSQSLALRPKLF